MRLSLPDNASKDMVIGTVIVELSDRGSDMGLTESFGAGILKVVHAGMLKLKASTIIKMNVGKGFISYFFDSYVISLRAIG
jgi:hypothetical protein